MTTGERERERARPRQHSLAAEDRQGGGEGARRANNRLLFFSFTTKKNRTAVGLGAASAATEDFGAARVQTKTGLCLWPGGEG